MGTFPPTHPAVSLEVTTNTMAKEETQKVQGQKVEKSEREVRWERLLEAYAKQNPAKYESKKAIGEFDKIPDSFV